ncbi:molecular chaperone GrpE [Gammaproteobacteria bacterium]
MLTIPSIDWKARVRGAWAALWCKGATIRRGSNLHIRVANLELDVRERDEEIHRLRQEYDRQREWSMRQQTEAAAMGFEVLARQLAPLLSQMATMKNLVDADRSVRVGDILKLFGKVEQVLVTAGLTRIGTIGVTVPFDTQLHQRMNGADFGDNDPVVVRFVGYRLGEAILCKAMVSSSGSV